MERLIPKSKLNRVYPYFSIKSKKFIIIVSGDTVNKIRSEHDTFNVCEFVLEHYTHDKKKSKMFTLLTLYPYNS